MNIPSHFEFNSDVRPEDNFDGYDSSEGDDDDDGHDTKRDVDENLSSRGPNSINHDEQPGRASHASGNPVITTTDTSVGTASSVVVGEELRGTATPASTMPTPSPVKAILAQRRQSREAAASAVLRGDMSSVWKELRARRLSMQSANDSTAHLDPVAEAHLAAAVESLKRAVSSSEREHGPNAEPTGRAWHALADAAARLGDSRGAALCYSRATESLGTSSAPAARLEAAAAAFKFAKLCCAESRYEAAVPAYRRVLLLRRGVLGEWHPALAEPALALANVLHEFIEGGSAEGAALTAIVLRILNENGCSDTALVENVEKLHASMSASATESTASAAETGAGDQKEEDDEFV